MTDTEVKKKNIFERIYFWLWFHSEFWIANKLHRRPFTFMMRDFWVEHKVWGWTIFAAVTALFAYILYLNRWAGGILFFIHAAVFAHLWWGTPYIKGEQENPPYTGEW
jgi:hypothetical protein